MTAKMDLLAKLAALMPECAGEIAKILHDYEIMPAKVYERSNLPRRVDAFLAAKRIDGCRPRTLEGYQERLKVLIGRCKKPVQKITTDDLREHIAYLVDERHLKDNSVQAHINAGQTDRHGAPTVSAPYAAHLRVACAVGWHGLDSYSAFARAYRPENDAHLCGDQSNPSTIRI